MISKKRIVHKTQKAINWSNESICSRWGLCLGIVGFLDGQRETVRGEPLIIHEALIASFCDCDFL